MSNKLQNTDTYYLPVEADALRWGMHVLDCGFSEIPAGKSYPLRQSLHPSEYQFSWETGRQLKEYQLIYITKGRGVFESEPTGRVRVEAGQVILLFPGVWHRYRPVKSEGWDENWFGFGGEYADRIMREFFSTQKAVIRTGYNEELRLCVRAMSELMKKAPPGYQQLLAAEATNALARVRSLSLGYCSANQGMMNIVQQARCFLLAHSDTVIDMPALAKRLGMSYASFRVLFKAQTGMAPNQYLLNIRINKAFELLTGTQQNITEIAERLGFSSVYYFSRLFKKKTDLSPLQWRAKNRATPPKIP